VALLDIKNPASLAALNYMGITAQIQKLVEHDLLILPDVAYAEPPEISLDFSRRSAVGFGLPVSEFVYSASPISNPSISTSSILFRMRPTWPAPVGHG